MRKNSGGGHAVVHIITAAACILICIGLAFGLKGYYGNKAWDTPAKKAEFPPEDNSPTMIDRIMDTGYDIVSLAQGNTDEVIANVDRALVGDPNNAELYVKRGAAYLLKGDIETASQNMDAASYLNPKYETLAAKCRTMRDMVGRADIQKDAQKVHAMLKPEDIQKAIQALGLGRNGGQTQSSQDSDR
jgi:cytochrome c-type biogenesis protein CcmH/NrfG